MIYDLFALILFPVLGQVAMIYLVLGLVLVLSGVGLPVPEEFTLLMGGYLAYVGYVAFWPVVYTLIVGILAADVMGYVIGRFAGNYVHKRVLCHVPFADEFLDKAKYYFHRHGDKVVLFSRPMFGVRVAVPLLAGHFRMRFVKFILWDAAAAIPWTLLLVFVSYYFSASLDVFTEIKEIKHIFFALLGLVLIGYVALRFIKQLRRKVDEH